MRGERALSTFKHYTRDNSGRRDRGDRGVDARRDYYPLKKREIYNVPCRYFVDACVVILRAVLALRPPDDTFVLVLGSVR